MYVCIMLQHTIAPPKKKPNHPHPQPSDTICSPILVFIDFLSHTLFGQNDNAAATEHSTMYMYISNIYTIHTESAAAAAHHMAIVPVLAWYAVFHGRRPRVPSLT